MNGSHQLLIAASLSFIAAFLHVLIILGGANWYRFFGAGENMAKLAESGSSQPAVITLGIAAVLTVWGFYALSGAGLIIKLPLLKVALVLITFVYLVRGIAGLIAPFVSSHPAISQNSLTFWLVSSVICCIFGVFHLLGLINQWHQLAGSA
ncbi:hypothetical protein CS022_20715 [Veronia nyctiphanis]|uniref:Uncharacterized protein n=1 Tax=Veronia nyctiphanis TaxID=1278244 RepID=A0A4Q0YL60_9GAMM|nr:hypothetical protein [Veronia nyctiphanis]RXJ71517.1 hypothetical protein CS022_20715 [Veronia nyctiphanis]